MLGRRGVHGSWYKKVCTFGGSIDRGETPEQAAIREAFEEGGVQIPPNQLKLSEYQTKFAHYYCILNEEPIVDGPPQRHAWEIYKSDRLSKDFFVNMILNKKGQNTGLAWVPVDLLLNSKEEYVVESPSTELIQSMRDRNLI